jgi:hypothetical protein
MRVISTIAALALVSASASVFAGEDSTDHWGAGGTGPAFWTTDCGLEGFPGPSVDAAKPCGVAGRHYQTSDQGQVPQRVIPNASVGGQQQPLGAAANDGHGGHKTPDTRK